MTYALKLVSHAVSFTCHVQNVSAYHSRLRGWLLPFRGVASRYLGNYLGWRWTLDGGRVKTPDALLRAALGIFHT